MEPLSAVEQADVQPVPLLLGEGMTARLVRLHGALGDLAHGGAAYDAGALADGVAALVEVASLPPAPAAVPLGWRASRLDIPWNGGCTLTAAGPLGEELVLHLDATGAPVVAGWSRRAGGAVVDTAIFDVRPGPGGLELRCDGTGFVRSAPMGPIPPGGVSWARTPVWGDGGAVASGMPPVGGLLVRGLAAAVSHLARGRAAGEAHPEPGVAPAAPVDGAPTLVVTSGPGAGRRFVLGDRAGIGRGEDNAVTLTDQLASRQHAVIERRADGYSLTDLDSLYGTAVNGERTGGPRRLAHGDEIVIGVTRLRFECEPFRAVPPGAPATAAEVAATPLTVASPVRDPGSVGGTEPAAATECPRCRATNRAGVTFCTVCGAPFEPVAPLCPECGRPVRPGVRFCTGCGRGM